MLSMTAREASPPFEQPGVNHKKDKDAEHQRQEQDHSRSLLPDLLNAVRNFGQVHARSTYTNISQNKAAQA
jgi:hypothetical protein